jgi:outer membrane protein assembly factor BamB
MMSLSLLSSTLLANEFAANWHQWRGPNANGSSLSANPPVQWGPDQNIKWKVEVPGKGYSTPIIWENRIIILTAIKTDRKPEQTADESASQQPAEQPRRGLSEPVPTTLYQFAVICYDRQTGERLWQTVAAEQVPHEGGHSTNSFASSSPVTNGQRIYVSFGSRGVYCLDMDGKEIWNRDLGRMQTRASFGEGSSPTLHGDTLVVPWDHEDQSSLIALDATNGQTRWKTERDERTTWATPLVVEHGGRTQVVTNGNRVRSYDLETGELIWECGGQVDNPIPSPVLQDDMVICMTGYRGNAIYAIPLSATGDITDTDKVVWSRTDAAPYVASPTLYKGQLYFTKSRNNLVSSLTAKTGDVLIDQQRLPDIETIYSSPVAAADRVYFTDRDGTTVVLKHGSTFEVLATNELGEGVDASPAIIGNEMFVRGEKHLYCLVSK